MPRAPVTSHVTGGSLTTVVSLLTVLVRELSVPGALEFTPVQHGDDRGVFMEWFREDEFVRATGRRGLHLAQANCSVSRVGTLRGIHFAELPPSQAKFVTCVSGAAFDVVVDLRVGSMFALPWPDASVDAAYSINGVWGGCVDALREGRGVCQDFAHLTLMLLRGMGIPSRYVSGYLHPRRNAKMGDTVEGQSHAWIQAWTGEWWHYDPTNDKEINEQYISVGVGRDYADVTPLKGIYSGQGSTDLDVVVEITRLA